VIFFFSPPLSHVVESSVSTIRRLISRLTSLKGFSSYGMMMYDSVHPPLSSEPIRRRRDGFLVTARLALLFSFPPETRVTISDSLLSAERQQGD